MDRASDMGEDLKSGTAVRRVVLAIALLMTFRNFQFFPGMPYVQELWFVLSFLALVVLYPVWKICRGLKFSSFELYVLVLAPTAVLLPAWGAWHEFGQPFWYGILAQRAIPLMVTALLLVNALRDRLVRLADIEGALLLCGWGTFVLYTLMRLTLNPADFTSYGVAFVGVVFLAGQGGRPIFILPSYFILYSFVYYALLGIRTRRKRYYFAAAILIAPNGGPVERSLAITIAATLLFFLYKWRPISGFLLSLSKACAAGVIVLGLAFAANPASLSSTVGRFSDAFRVMLGGSEVDDPSANARLFEALIALPYIQKHPLLGSGEISNQWEGGINERLGAIFYDDDIGLMGILFSRGAIGLLLFAYQYRFAMRAARKLPEERHSALADGAMGFLLFSAINSLTTGMFVFSPEVTLFFVALIFGISEYCSKEILSHSSVPLCRVQTPVLLP